MTLLTALTKQRLALGALTLAAIPMTLIALEGAEPKASTPGTVVPRYATIGCPDKQRLILGLPLVRNNFDGLLAFSRSHGCFILMPRGVFGRMGWRSVIKNDDGNVLEIVPINEQESEGNYYCLVSYFGNGHWQGRLWVNCAAMEVQSLNKKQLAITLPLILFLIT